MNKRGISSEDFQARERNKSQARMASAREKIASKKHDPLPLFDCLYCCQEHFVLKQFSKRVMQHQYHHMHEEAYHFAKKRWLHYDDLQDPF